jgi:alpha-mannosidase
METLKANRKRRVRVAVPVSAPPCGYATLYARRALGRTGAPPADWQIQERGAENTHLRLQIEGDGGLTLTHKATGKTYRDLNHFEDVGDAGDEYTFCPLVGDQPVTTCGNPATVRQLWAGPNAVCFEITHQLALPAGLSPDRRSREGSVSATITSWVTLPRDCPYVQIRTAFDNRVHDHKLSAVFPTDLAPEVAYVDESFAVVERQIDLPDSMGWVEDPTPLMHQRTFTDLNDGTRGLAIMNRGLAAVEATRTDGGTRLAVPLVRAVGWLSRRSVGAAVAAGH